MVATRTLLQPEVTSPMGVGRFDLRSVVIQSGTFRTERSSGE